MTRNEFYTMIGNPEALRDAYKDPLKELVRDYPYFQAGWMLLLKCLNNTQNIEFDHRLGAAAIHVASRKALFLLINRKLQKKHIPADFFEDVPDDLGAFGDLSSLALKPLSPALRTQPVVREAERDMNFMEWLEYFEQKAEVKNLRHENSRAGEPAEPGQNKRESNLKLIDDFLTMAEEAQSLRIVIPQEKKTAQPVDNTPVTNDIYEQSTRENEDLFTETLANLYIKQQKIDRAINIFIKLSLKYPEKSSYFAARIESLRGRKDSE